MLRTVEIGTRGRVFAMLLLVTALGIAPRESVAQQATLSTSDPSIRIRLNSTPDTWLQGTLLRSSPDSLWLQSLGVRDTLGIERARISQLQAYEGRTSSAGTGALIGGAIGATTSLVALVDYGSDGSDVPVGGAVLVTAVLGAAGALLGTLVGLAIKKDNWVDLPPVGLAIEGSEESIRVSVGLGPSHR